VNRPTKITCPWCLELVDRRGANRWHFDKCPLKSVVKKKLGEENGRD